MKFAIIGLGRMGYNLALHAAEKGHEVLAWNRTAGKAKQLVEEITGWGGKAKALERLEEIADMERPRVVWLMLPAGVTGEYVEKASSFMEEGDVLIDGSNSFYKHSMERGKKLERKGIHFLDIGVSGGIEGARHGASMMVGGSKEGFSIAEPLIRDLCVEDGYAYLGGYGAGHYAKMIHNGVEYAMMEAIGEGIDMLVESDFGYKLEDVIKTWRNGSVIRGWLMDLLHEAVKQGLENFPEEIGQSGEGLWTVEEALRKGIPLPAITASVFRRFASKRKRNYGNRAIQALRHMFGGHDEKNRIPDS